MSWQDPFRQNWPSPVEDLRRRFGLVKPSFTPRQLAAFTGILVAAMFLLVLVLETVV